eukprot:TRINITY_DN20612_c0_g1_i1.p1 TRINITY_DN20612_c0_g1~~TRINITY_DN20612_c0_g1_i1.p1  ORF type:complete len:122 (+),score=16.41 TRINITY_DN20612_c0_g1_i1:41-367(+)
MYGLIPIVDVKTQCLFCRNKETTSIGYSHFTCSCGAKAWTAASVDKDEIIDPALFHYKIKFKDSSRGYNSELVRDMMETIDIRVTEYTSNPDSFWGNQCIMWFLPKNQ